MSEQMERLLKNYNVTTEKQLLREIAKEYSRETGEKFTVRDAELMLDGMLEAEYQRIEGGYYDKKQECLICSIWLDKNQDDMERSWCAECLAEEIKTGMEEN